MRYLICTLYLIVAFVFSDRVFAQGASDCSKIVNAADRVNCQVDSRVSETKAQGKKKALKTKKKKK
jgi:hypothetical protein